MGHVRHGKKGLRARSMDLGVHSEAGEHGETQRNDLWRAAGPDAAGGPGNATPAALGGRDAGEPNSCIAIDLGLGSLSNAAAPSSGSSSCGWP